MAHRDFIRPFGQWGPEMVPVAADWQRFDVAQADGLDGAAGGTYAPATPIILGGSGIQFGASSASTWTLSGSIETRNGGRLVHGDQDYTTLGGYTRTIVVPLLPGLEGDGDAVTNASGIPSLDATLLGTTGISTSAGALADIALDRWLHHGATLEAVTLYAATRAATSTLSAKVVRYDPNGNKTNLFTISTGLLSNTASANYAPRPFAMTFIGGGTTNVINRANYFYALQVSGQPTTIFTRAVLTLNAIEVFGNS